jgi:hypothetical protein
MVSPASLRHQELAGFLNAVLRDWAEAHDLGLVVAAPFQMHLPEPVERGRQPDFLFVARAHHNRLGPTYLEGPANLVMEILATTPLA